MFVLKGVIVTENDLGARKNGGDFFVLGKRLLGDPRFLYFVTINCNLWVFWIFIIVWFFLLGVMTFGKPQIFEFMLQLNVISWFFWIL